MKNESSRNDSVVQTNARAKSSAASANASTAPAKDAAASRCVRLGLAATLGASLVLFLPDIQHAPQRYPEPAGKVTGVEASGNTISIKADGSLNRAQTWQDPEGFHVMLVNGQAEMAGPSHGVKVRRVSNTLELVVPVRQGASVTVGPRGTPPNLAVSA